MESELQAELERVWDMSLKDGIYKNIPIPSMVGNIYRYDMNDTVANNTARLIIIPTKEIEDVGGEGVFLPSWNIEFVASYDYDQATYPRYEIPNRIAQAIQRLYRFKRIHNYYGSSFKKSDFIEETNSIENSALGRFAVTNVTIKIY